MALERFAKEKRGRSSFPVSVGKRTTTVYNIASQTVARLDANNHRVSTLYDATGRSLSQIDALEAEKSGWHRFDLA